MESRALGDEASEESILRQQDLEKGMDATSSFDDAARFAAAAAVLRDQQGQAGAGFFGASALQRVGGASTEFFRTAPDSKDEAQKRGNEFLKQILEEIRNGEPLVLGGSN